MVMFSTDQLKDSNNAPLTQSLFVETNGTTKAPIMTLGDHDLKMGDKVLYSLKRIYMEEQDPEEYKVAMRVFGSWAHWKRLLDNKKIMKYILQYREELDVSIRSEAVRSLIKSATDEGVKGVSAAKYIAEKGWKKRKAGAPSKEEVKYELKVQAEMDSDLADDMKRLNLRVVK